MSETPSKRTVREERTQDTCNLYLGKADRVCPEKNTKGNISASKGQACSSPWGKISGGDFG